MYNFIVILILLVCVLLAVVVLVQNSKGGGLAANFSAPNQIMGVRKTTDFLEKTTWILALVLMVLSIAATATIKTKRPVTNENIQTEVNVNDFNPVSQAPAAQAPAAEAPVAE